MAPELLTGWGRTAPTAAEVLRPRSPEEVSELLAAAGGRGVIARGLGRSYGDAAQNAGGAVIDTTGVDAPMEVDPDTGVARLGGGVSLDAVMRHALPRGWFVPVTPGTRQVTVGGAVAADIHGKNHHHDGSFATHVSALTLATPAGVRRLGPDDELFWATAGGMGLTGVVTEAVVRLMPVETAYVWVDTDRTPDLDSTLALMAASDADYRYSVAWIDCLTRGASMGRSVLTRGDHASLDQLPQKARGAALSFSSAARLAAPPWAPAGLLNRLSIRAFNEAWYRKAPRRQRGRIHSIGSFFHPLDGVSGWNRLYGKRGFLQYQLVVPFGAEDALRRAVERLARGDCPSFLGVLKAFGPADPGPLSFPAPGWTLALDLPVGPPTLASLLDELDEVVAGAGGRVYLAKDSRLRPELVEKMYPRLGEWRAVRAAADPAGVLRSDLARRLGLLEDTK
ncbi:MAG TPA: FAD-binding oxidoreductase [Acidimicrobiales bacterium]|nr:FAD-binding oxidoreductase [Acidimicrobiales bacterium]